MENWLALFFFLWNVVPGAESLNLAEWPLKAWTRFMHEHLPVGCQSRDSIVEIRNKWEINYLRRRGSGFHAGRRGGKPGMGRTSWCWWIQLCKLVCTVGSPSFYKGSGCICKILSTPPGGSGMRDGAKGGGGMHALFSINLRSVSPASFLPLLQLTPWPARAPLLKYSNTNGFWQPAIMRNNRLRLPESRSRGGGQVLAPATLPLH